LLTIAVMPAKTWIINLATDDALYYPVVARNIALGLGSTYDGITYTNGYHPLWCWLQVPVAWLLGGLGSMTYLFFIKLLMVALVAAALVIWARTVSQLSESRWMSASFVLLLGAYWWSVRTMYGGMETALVVLCIGICLLLANNLIRDRSYPTAISLGVAFAACFLARLDTVFFIAVLAITVLVKLGRGARLQAAWILPASLLPLPYLLWNLNAFGSAVPVSGLRKTLASPDLAYQYGIIENFISVKIGKLADVFHPLGIGILLLTVIAAGWLGRRSLLEQSRKMGILWVIPPAAALHFAYIAIFMTEADVAWYQYLEHLSVFLIVGLLVASTAEWLGQVNSTRIVTWVPLAAVCIFVLAILFVYAPRKLPNSINVASYGAATWAREHLQEGNPRFGMYDSGVFRFVSGFDTVAINGLAGDRTTMRLAKEGKRAEIITRYEIDYVVEFVADLTILTIPPRYVLYRSEKFVFNANGPGRYLIVDSKWWNYKGSKLGAG